MVTKLLSIVIIVFLMNHFGQAQADTLSRVGQGEAYYLGFIKVYDAALFSQDNAEGHDILDANVSKCLRLKYAANLKVEDFIKGANTVLQRQHNSAELVKIEEELKTFHNSYQDVQKGDEYSLCYSAPNRNTVLSLNGKDLVTIHSMDFAQKYFGIWLGPDKPLDEDLRNDLLGTKNNS